MVNYMQVYNGLTGDFNLVSTSQGAPLPVLPAQTVATTGALTATYANGAAGIGATLTNAGALATLAVDGVTLAAGNTLLVKNQAAPAQNGLYTVTVAGSGAVAWVLTRTTNYDTPAEIKPGELIPIQSGTVNANTIWIQNDVVTVIGTDPIQFSQFSSAAFATTNHAVLVGGLNNTVQNVGPGLTGEVFAGNTGANPGFTATPSVTSMSIANAPTNPTDGTNKTYVDTKSHTLTVTIPGAYPYTSLTTDDLVLIDSSAARTINLEVAPASGISHIYKDNTGNAGTFNITIVPAAGTIDGQANYVINSDYGAVELAYNGTQWNVL